MKSSLMKMSNLFSSMNEKFNFYFILVFFVALSLKFCLLDSSLSFSAEVWAETATNYYMPPIELGFWQSFMKLDFGYLPLWPRLVANLFYLLQVSPRWIPLCYQFFSLVFISFCVAFINLKRNRTIISSDRWRLFLSLLLCLHLDYELHTFINFSYWSLIPTLFFTAALYFEQPSTSILTQGEKNLMAIWISLCLLSKAIMVALLPIFFVAIFKKRSRFFFSIFTCLAVIQLVITFFNVPKINQFHSTLNPIEFIHNFYIYGSLFPWFLMFSNSHFLFTYKYVIAFISTALILYSGLKIYRHFNAKFWFILALCGSFLMSLAIILRGYPQFFFINSLTDAFPFHHLKSRLLFFPIIVLYFLIFILKSTQSVSKVQSVLFIKNKEKLFSIFFVLIFIIKNPVLVSSLTPQHRGFPTTKNTLFSEFSNPEKEECLPINPFPWVLNDNECDYLILPESPVIFDSHLTFFPESSFQVNVPNFPEPQKLKYIHLFFEKINIDQLMIFLETQTHEWIQLTAYVLNQNTLRIPVSTSEKIINIRFSGIKKISTVNQKPFVLFLGSGVKHEK